MNSATPKHAPGCRQETQTLWQRILGEPWHPLMLVERYELLDGGQAICQTCANCGRTTVHRITVEGRRIPLEGTDVYGTPTELATVIT